MIKTLKNRSMLVFMAASVLFNIISLGFIPAPRAEALASASFTVGVDWEEVAIGKLWNRLGTGGERPSDQLDLESPRRKAIKDDLKLVFIHESGREYPVDVNLRNLARIRTDNGWNGAEIIGGDTSQAQNRIPIRLTGLLAGDYDAEIRYQELVLYSSTIPSWGDFGENENYVSADVPTFEWGEGIFGNIWNGLNTLGGETNSNETDVEGNTCEGSSIIGWVLCGAVRLLYTGINFFYTSIVLPGLQIDPLDNQSAVGTPEHYIYKVWSSFRVLANIMFIGIFLLAIIGQSFSWFLTPYELKKILPRLFIGAIGIQLSWYIAGFTIDVFNVLGAGVRGLILSAGGGATFDIDLGYSGTGDSPWSLLGDGLGLGTTTLVGFGIKSYFGAKGIVMGLTLILLPIILLIVTAAMIISIRKIVILLLIAISPIAFALWILPGTEDMFKRWWGLFWKALLMYPLIIALIAGGRLSSRLVGDLGLNGGLEVLIGVVALFAPYLLIPATFKFAGSILGTISSSASGASKGMQDRIFGDPHSEFSFRGRMHEAGVSRRMDRKIARADKASPALGAVGGAYRAARKSRTGRRTWQDKGKVGSYAGKVLDRTSGAAAGAGSAAKTWATGGAGGRMRALGAMATGAQLRAGPGLTRAMAERNAHRMETIANLGGYDSEVLVAILAGHEGATNPITGRTIKYANALGAVGGTANFFGAEPLIEDRAAVQGAMVGLVGRLSTAPQMAAAREMLLHNPHLDDRVKEDIWEVVRVNDFVDQVSPEMRYTRLDGSYEFEAKENTPEAHASAQAAAVEMAGRVYDTVELTRQLPNARAGVWSAMTALDQSLQGYAPGGDGKVAEAQARLRSINKAVEDTVASEISMVKQNDTSGVFEDIKSFDQVKYAHEVYTDEKDGLKKIRQKKTKDEQPVYDLTDPYTANLFYRVPSNRSGATAEGNAARYEHVMLAQQAEKQSQFGSLSQSELSTIVQNSYPPAADATAAQNNFNDVLKRTGISIDPTTNGVALGEFAQPRRDQRTAAIPLNHVEGHN